MKESDKLCRLNLGCGKRLLPGYVNIDFNPFEGVIVMDVRNLQYPDDSVDEILAEFILEHIPYFEVPETLWEWWRVLCPGGILKLMVPDFEMLAKAYLAKTIRRQELHCQLFNSPIINPKKQTPHYNAFDKPYLIEVLEQEGFEIQSMRNEGTDVIVVAKKILKESVCR